MHLGTALPFLVSANCFLYVGGAVFFSLSSSRTGKKIGEEFFYAATKHDVSFKLFATDIICLGSVFLRKSLQCFLTLLNFNVENFKIL